jgi:hypothetical protein
VETARRAQTAVFLRASCHPGGDVDGAGQLRGIDAYAIHTL